MTNVFCEYAQENLEISIKSRVIGCDGHILLAKQIFLGVNLLLIRDKVLKRSDFYTVLPRGAMVTKKAMKSDGAKAV